ncbi:MAG: TraR/DksA C4-type zinc finger protein [Candidatus Sungbacteria bacterium]|nr:TraR/DksA C4-type zinc finger protein [bacterium]MDZ4285821.1 TraR/DksA C4-type zinc finger protein [Candidatus Sungbacteria bacterium]
MDTSHLEEYKKILEQERERIVSELSSIAKPDPAIKGNWVADFPQMETNETGSHASRDEEEDEVEEYETRLEAEHSLESRLLNVTKALHRIESGTYGTCATCGKEIPIERLQANPAAEFDIEHQK